ncbi:MAG: ATP-dependent DNA ligase clustered with Ku protein, LigD, partial [uncultured Frankineae bacterium]
ERHADRRGRRRPPGRPVQPRQGALPRRRLHQGAGPGLLHAHRPGPAAAPRRAGADPQALPRRRAGAGLLREERTARHARVGAHRAPALAGVEQAAGDDRLRRRGRPRHARVDREPGQPRAAHPHVAGRPGRSRPRRLRPRPGSAGDDRRVLPGRLPAPAAAGGRRARAAGQDVGQQGPAAVRPRRRPRLQRADVGVRQGPRPAAGEGGARPRRAPDDQGAAGREGARRLVAEQRRQDHGVGLQPARARPPDGVGPRHVGRGRGLRLAGRPRLRQRRRARARRPLRRPVRAAARL